MKNTIQHFTHPSHGLVFLDDVDDPTGYLCNGCMTLGAGSRFRCHACDFNLHEYCGKCPETFSSFMHQHPLSLVVRKSKATRQNDRTCDVCRESVEGMFYRCKLCDFDVHPLCTQLPQFIRHALHPVHRLEFQTVASPGSCAQCGSACNSWRYRCGDCGFDIHPGCVLIPVDPEASNTSCPSSRSRSVSSSHPFTGAGGYGHGYGFPGWAAPPHYWGHGYNPYGQMPPPWYNTSCPYNIQSSMNQSQGGSSSPSPSQVGWPGKTMFALVRHLALGSLSNIMFGDMDLSSFFSF